MLIYIIVNKFTKESPQILSNLSMDTTPYCTRHSNMRRFASQTLRQRTLYPLESSILMFKGIYENSRNKNRSRI